MTGLAEGERNPTLVWHHPRATDHFQIGYFREVSQDLVLYTIGKIGVGFVFASIFKWKHRNSGCGEFLEALIISDRIEHCIGTEPPRAWRRDHSHSSTERGRDERR